MAWSPIYDLLEQPILIEYENIEKMNKNEYRSRNNLSMKSNKY